MRRLLIKPLPTALLGPVALQAVMILVGLLRHNLTSLMASQPKTDAKAIRETYVSVTLILLRRAT